MPLKINLYPPSQPSFIGSYLLDDLTLCDRFIEYFKNSKDKQLPGTTSKFGNTLVDKEVKDSIDVGIYFDENLTIWQEYLKENQKICNEYIKEFVFADGYAAWGITGFTNIQYYPPNGGYKKWHTERTSTNFPETTRHLVFMTFLNDVSDGGETEFLYQKIKVQPRKGLTLIWPADWTHTHRGIPSPSQEKYILTGWYNFLQ